MTMVDTSGSVHSGNQGSPERQTTLRRYKRTIITCGVLLFLVWILDFNPLHPIRWAHDFHAAWERGTAAGKAAKLRYDQQHR
jgi:hypothetical protein